MRRSQSRGVRQTPTTEKRSGVDRRRKNQFNMRSLLFGGRRENLRRYEDRQRAFLADQYHQSLFGVIVVILLLSVVDAILTLFLINHGAIEVNPIMAFYIDFGPYTFLSVKYGLTCAGLMILLIFKNLFLRSMRIETGAFLYVILAAFIGVVSWQLFLIHSVIA
jgi:hypothetical protein